MRTHDDAQIVGCHSLALLGYTHAHPNNGRRRRRKNARRRVQCNTHSVLGAAGTRWIVFDCSRSKTTATAQQSSHRPLTAGQHARWDFPVQLAHIFVPPSSSSLPPFVSRICHVRSLCRCRCYVVRTFKRRERRANRSALSSSLLRRRWVGGVYMSGGGYVLNCWRWPWHRVCVCV